MLDRLLGRTPPPIVKQFESVEIFNRLIGERDQARGKAGRLTRGLEGAEARLAEIPKEEQDIKDDHYRAHVKRELDPSQPDRTDLTTQQLKSLADERSDLQGKVAAYREELTSIHRVLGKLEGEHGAVERARRAAWQAIADELIGAVSPDFRDQFHRLWVALDRVCDGIYPASVLARLVETELTIERKTQTIDTLRREFVVANEYD